MGQKRKPTEKQPVIDLPESMPVTVPAALLDRINQYQPSLVSVGIQWMGSSGWQVGRDIIRYESAMDKQPEEIAQEVLGLMYKDIEAREKKRQDPAPSYRAMLGTQQANRLRYRYASLMPKVGPDGDMILVDAPNDSGGLAESEAVQTSKLLAEVAESHARISLDCLRAVSDSVKSWASAGDALKSMGEGFATMARESSEGQAAVLKARLEGAQLLLDHEAEMHRVDRVTSLLEKAGAGPMGKEIGGLFRDLMMAKVRDIRRNARKTSANGRDPKDAKSAPFCVRLRQIWDKLGGERQKKLEELLPEAERDILAAARKDCSDAEFHAMLNRLLDIISERTDAEKHLGAIEDALGDTVEVFHALMQDVSEFSEQATAAAG